MRFFPVPQRLRLDNGMEIYVVERPGQPSAEVQCHVRTGSIHEEEFLGCGLSHFLEHMLFQGCRDFPGNSVADFFNAAGGDINAYTSFDRTVYHATVPGDFAVEAVRALGSMVRYPDFPEERFAAERDVILRECDRGNDNPHHRLFHRLQEMIFPQHPMAYPVIGNPMQIAEVTRERMASYWSKRYLPGRIFWVVVGAVHAAEIFDAVSAVMGDWQTALPREVVLPPLRERHAVMMQEMHFADPLSRVAFGAPLPPLNDDRIPAMDLAISLAAGGDASALMRKLRLERELATQFADSSFGQPVGGMMLFFAAAPQKKIGTVTSVLRKTLADLAKNGFSRHEVAREKTIQFSEELQSLRENGEIALRLGDALHCGESPEWIDRMLQKRQSLTVDEVNDAAAWLFEESRASILTQIPPENTAEKMAGKQQKSAETFAAVAAPNTVYRAARQLPLCDFSLVMPGGVIFESPENAGATYLITQLLTAGSDGISEKAVADKLDSMGASLHLSGGNNSLSLRLTAPRKNFARSLEFLGRLLRAPDFAPDTFAREQGAAIQNSMSRRSEPGRAADAAVRKMLFHTHPYSRIPSGNPEDFAGLTPEKLRAFYHSLWQKDRVVLGFGGDLSETECLHFADDLRAMLPWTDRGIALPEMPEFPREIRRQTIGLPRAQSVVLAGMPLVTATCREWQIFLALNDAMNGLSSRLYQNIREKHALAYSVGMRLAGGYHPGYCSLIAATAPENADKVEALLLEEIEHLRKVGITPQEWQEAVKGTLLSIRQQLASPVAALSAATLDVYYGEKADRLQREAEFLQQLSPEEAARVIRDHFSGVVPQIVRTMPQEKK